MLHPRNAKPCYGVQEELLYVIYKLPTVVISRRTDQYSKAYENLMGQQPLQGPPFKSKGPGPQLRAPGPPAGPPVMLQHTGPALVIPQAGSTDRLNPAPSFGTLCLLQPVTMLDQAMYVMNPVHIDSCICRLSSYDLKQVLYLSTKTAGGCIPTTKHEHHNQTSEALPRSHEVITAAAGCLSWLQRAWSPLVQCCADPIDEQHVGSCEFAVATEGEISS